LFGKTLLKAQNDYIFQKFGGARPLWPPLATPMFDGPAIPHNLFREEEVGNLATTDKLDEPSETESSDEEEWSEDSDDSDSEYDVC